MTPPRPRATAASSAPEQLDAPVGPIASTGFWLKITAQAWQRELDRALRDLDLTTAQFSVLAAAGWLARKGQPPTQQQVSDFSGTDRMLTSKLLAGLEARGLLERTPDADDARARRVQVTPAGGTLVKDSTARARRVDSNLFGQDTSIRETLRARFGHLAG